jgi:putative lipoic acid-binding regulatory protein
MSEPSGIQYPLDFPLKIMGYNQPGFAEAATAIVRKHAPDFDPATVETRGSRKNTYLSLTCIIRAQSRSQLDALYQELNDHPMVVMVL